MKAIYDRLEEVPVLSNEAHSVFFLDINIPGRPWAGLIEEQDLKLFKPRISSMGLSLTERSLRQEIVVSYARKVITTQFFEGMAKAKSRSPGRGA
jgi:hypothetical protein